MDILSAVLVLMGIALSIYGLKNLNDFREEAREARLLLGNNDSAWPENFLNVWLSGSGLDLFLIGCALWAKVDLRINGAMLIIIMVVGALSLLALGIFLYNEKLMPKIEKRRIKKEAQEKMWQDYLAKSDPSAPTQAPSPTPVAPPQQVAPVRPLPAQPVQSVPQQFAPATAAAIQAQAQPASPVLVPQVQPTLPAKLVGGADAQSVLGCYLKEYELSKAFEKMALGPEKAKTGQALYAQKTQCYAMEPVFNGLSPDDRDWVNSKYSLGIAKINAAHAAALAPAPVQAQVIPVTQAAATKAGTANGIRDPFAEPEIVPSFMRAPAKAAAPKIKPVPKKQPTKGSTATKKTTPPTARK